MERGDKLHGNSLSSILQCPGLYPFMPSTIHSQPHLERTLQLCHLYGVDSTWEATDTGYKPSLNWHRVQCQGLLPMVGEIFVSHWIATTHLKLGRPQSVRCCPAMVCFLHWVHESTSPRPSTLSAEMASSRLSIRSAVPQDCTA